MKPCLPQNDPHPKQRDKKLADIRELYQYNYDLVASLPMLDSVPHREHPSVAWLAMVSDRLLHVLVNGASVAEDQARSNPDHESHQRLFQGVRNGKEGGIRAVFSHIIESAIEGIVKGPPESFEQYATIFQKIPRPAIVADYQLDATFARMRVAGANPAWIRGMTERDDRLPVTDEHFRAVMGKDDSLDAAVAERRLYLADYAVLEGAVTGTFPDGRKYLCDPLALFAVPAAGAADRALRPVAIQLGQTPGDAPMMSPGAGVAWTIAKSIVQTADGSVHEAVAHLARTHFAMEPVVIATKRRLSPRHPLSLLLQPHQEGTLEINDAAQDKLIAPGGGVDALLSGSIETSRGLAVKGIETWDFNAHMLPADLEARGVESVDALPDYPYRDDALLVWSAIHDWVGAYLAVYYHGDEDVRDDVELQAWAAEIKSEGRMNGFGEDGGIKTLAYLEDAVTMIIFTGSAQHAAVNFPQYGLMAYAPNMPLSAYLPTPTAASSLTDADYKALLPPLDMAMVQAHFGYLLGNVYYTQLGEYHGDILHPSFHNAKEREPMKRFQEELKEIERVITARNRTRSPYEYLLPSKIPQSINI